MNDIEKKIEEFNTFFDCQGHVNNKCPEDCYYKEDCSHPEHMQFLRQALQEQQEKHKTCNWKKDCDYDGNESYITECGQEYCFIEGGVKENGYKYCPNCGKLIKQLEGKG